MGGRRTSPFKVSVPRSSLNKPIDHVLRRDLVYSILDKTPHSGTAEEWLNNKNMSFDTITDDEIRKIIKELNENKTSV